MQTTFERVAHTGPASWAHVTCLLLVVFSVSAMHARRCSYVVCLCTRAGSRPLQSSLPVVSAIVAIGLSVSSWLSVWSFYSGGCRVSLSAVLSLSAFPVWRFCGLFLFIYPVCRVLRLCLARSSRPVSSVSELALGLAKWTILPTGDQTDLNIWTLGRSLFSV